MKRSENYISGRKEAAEDILAEDLRQHPSLSRERSKPQRVQLKVGPCDESTLWVMEGMRNPKASAGAAQTPRAATEGAEAWRRSQRPKPAGRTERRRCRARPAGGGGRGGARSHAQATPSPGHAPRPAAPRPAAPRFWEVTQGGAPHPTRGVRQLLWMGLEVSSRPVAPSLDLLLPLWQRRGYFQTLPLLSGHVTASFNS
ncbi:uncharacterized protein RHO17_017550 isoform 1-T2 [Thomomys bottae]